MNSLYAEIAQKSWHCLKLIREVNFHMKYPNLSSYKDKDNTLKIISDTINKRSVNSIEVGHFFYYFYPVKSKEGASVPENALSNM